MRIVFVALFLTSCNYFSANKSAVKEALERVSTEKLDTVKIKPYSTTAKPEIFETAFFEGTRAKMDTTPISFYAIDMGKINIESGKIIACDPIVMRDGVPFLQTFPIGRFPVQLAIAKVHTDERVAYSRVVFSDKPVSKWEFAIKDGQKQMPIDSGSFYGYGVDGGIGLFIDKQSNTFFDSLDKQDKNIWVTVFQEEMGKHYRNTWEYVLYDFGTHNLASFSTGYGDGSYGTYVGYDDKGNICRLLTDFGLVTWWEKQGNH